MTGSIAALTAHERLRSGCRSGFRSRLRCWLRSRFRSRLRSRCDNRLYARPVIQRSSRVVGKLSNLRQRNGEDVADVSRVQEEELATGILETGLRTRSKAGSRSRSLQTPG